MSIHFSFSGLSYRKDISGRLLPRTTALLRIGIFFVLSVGLAKIGLCEGKRGLPNIVVILADDLGYGDIGCYGATKVKTPNLDRLALQGVRFTDAHSTSATCTPSRYGLLTGEYPWRKKGTEVLPGDAALIIEPGRPTLPAVLHAAGYVTAAIGKWHLGLGPRRGSGNDSGKIDWNGEIRPGPLEIGFDYSFIMPATGDRVPCVYLENHRVVGLEPGDPIEVHYGKMNAVTATKFNEPTGKDHPELLKMNLSQGHDGTIVNGISRIGFMSGGKRARWDDETIADTLSSKACAFIEKSSARADHPGKSTERAAEKPFFLYLATHDIHVPRVPSKRYRGSSGCGVRGDVIQQFDGTVGEVMATLQRLHLAENTLVIVTSDNGPVLNDGYDDDADQDFKGLYPAGPLRGGKYTIWEGGTRVPWIARWPGHIEPATMSSALVCQVDMLATFAALAGQKLPAGAGPDSLNLLPAFLGKTNLGRNQLVEHSFKNLALRDGLWKFVPDIQPKPQLFDLGNDLGERNNVAGQHAQEVEDAARWLKMSVEKQ
jgi:arylsulfatase A-like enzyme